MALSLTGALTRHIVYLNSEFFFSKLYNNKKIKINKSFIYCRYDTLMVSAIKESILICAVTSGDEDIVPIKGFSFLGPYSAFVA